MLRIVWKWRFWADRHRTLENLKTWKLMNQKKFFKKDTRHLNWQISLSSISSVLYIVYKPWEEFRNKTNEQKSFFFFSDIEKVILSKTKYRTYYKNAKWRKSWLALGRTLTSQTNQNLTFVCLVKFKRSSLLWMVGSWTNNYYINIKSIVSMRVEETAFLHRLLSESHTHLHSLFCNVLFLIFRFYS